MDPEERKRRIRRILVAIDASSASMAALHTAIELAARLEAELLVLFVEDINLLRLSALPFAREVGNFSASLRQVDESNIERQMRAQARSVKQAVESLAHHDQVRWQFQTSRGVIPVEVVKMAEQTDLVILGRIGWTGRRSLGSTARVVALQSPRPAFLLKRRVPPNQAVLVVYNGSQMARKALQTALEVSDDINRLIILVSAKNYDEAKRLREEAQEILGARQGQYQVRWMEAVVLPAISALINKENAGMLIWPADPELLPQDELMVMINQIDIAVLLVR